MSADAVTTRAYTPADRKQVTALLADLPDLYPGAEQWLRRRLDAYVSRRTFIFVAVTAANDIVGVVIVVPKGEHRMKLATLYVDPRWRGRRVGHELVGCASRLWNSGDVREVYLTAASESAAGVHAVVSRYGFEREAYLADRYGRGRDEVVMVWNQRRYVLALRSHHANRIYEHVKTWEFRRVRASITPGSRVLIYESGGVGLVTGEFAVASVRYGTPEEMVALEPNERSRADALEYLAGAKLATALQTKNARRYQRPLTLASLGVARAPQSYQQLRD